MSTIDRITAVWSGVPGLPGYTNLYFTDALGMTDEVLAFFNTIRTKIPSNVTVTVASNGDTYTAETGELVGSWSEAGGGAVTGEGNTEHSGPTGAVVNLQTTSINRGHKVRGRFFLVPLSWDSYDGNGSIADAYLSTLRDAATALLADTNDRLVVWSRPRSGSGGMAAVVTSTSVPDLAAVLRSRRD